MRGILGLGRRAINAGLSLVGLRLIRISRKQAHESKRANLLRNLDISVVFDVGANRGDYALGLRQLGYRGKIVSFEPQKAAFAALTAAAAKDPNWVAVNAALGEAKCERSLNVSRNSYSSSFLDVSAEILTIEKGIEPVAQETVNVLTLDEIWSAYASRADRILLKLDVQGFEGAVLAGAKTFLTSCLALQIELALFPSYIGQKLLPEMLARLSAHGFRVVFLEDGFSDPSTGYVLEVDGIFVNTHLTGDRNPAMSGF